MVNVIKATGEIEPFSKEKLAASIKRAGIPENLEDKVLNHVEDKLYENIPTSEVYSHITEFLGETHTPSKIKYSLKHAIMSLGPTGYPFEDYVSELLKKMGYTTETRSLLKGRCVTHEVDVVAQKDHPFARIMVEAKFHNTPGTRTDVHVALYTKARFDDVKEKHNLTEGMIVTNTKVTTDALSYALCSGMKVLGWSYPQEESIRDLIEKYSLWPITFLSQISLPQIQTLVENHIVLLSDVIEKPESLDILALDPQVKKKVLEEAKRILG